MSLIEARTAAIYRAFHARAADIRANTLCPCDGCQQAGNLKIKLVGHVGGVAVQKVKRLTELAGVDVIVVHRMLKNAVPVTEYLLVTRPVHAMLGASLRSAPHRSISNSTISARRPRFISISPNAWRHCRPRANARRSRASDAISASKCATFRTRCACARRAPAFATCPMHAEMPRGGARCVARSCR